MTLRSTLMLASTALVGISGVANAQTTTLYAGGASLPAPYIRQAADCFGQKMGLANRGVAQTQAITDFVFKGSPKVVCDENAPATGTLPAGSIVNANAEVTYTSAGSGAGIAAFFTKNAQLGFSSRDWAGGVTFLAAGAVKAPTNNGNAGVTFAVSETAIGATGSNSVAVYNNGSTTFETSRTILAPTDDQSTANNTSIFRNPRVSYGAMIQVPALVAPVTVAFDLVYKKTANASGKVTSYSLNFAGKRSDGSGGLDLSTTSFCGIFQGTITNWKDVPGVYLASTDPVAIAAFPGNTAAQKTVPADVPLQIVGRSDSSGTTSVFTRYVSRVCGTSIYTNSTSTLPGTLQGPVYNKANANTPVAGETLGKFTRADQSDGVAKYLDFTSVPANGTTLVQSRVGYLGADYVLPFVRNTAANNYGLATADLENTDAKFAQGTPKNVTLSVKGISAPQSDASGNYVAANPGSRANPAATITDSPWVQASDRAAPIANPDPDGALTTHYPIVGTSNFLIYTCYADAATTGVVRQFFDWYFNSPTVNDTSKGILALAGFSPSSTGFRKAIRETFITPATAAVAGLKLSIRQTGSSDVVLGTTQNQCQVGQSVNGGAAFQGPGA